MTGPISSGSPRVAGNIPEMPSQLKARTQEAVRLNYGGISRALPVWLILGVVALSVDERKTQGAWTLSAMSLSALSLILGLWIFWNHGGNRITAASVYGFTFALFVGFAGIYTLTSYRKNEYIPYFLPALASAYIGQVLVYCIWWWDARNIGSETADIQPVADPATTQWGARVGGLLLTACLAAILLGYSSGAIKEFAFASAILMITSMFLRPGGRPRFCAVVALGLLGLFAKFVFSGFGRLELGAFGLALAFSACAQFRGRQVKFTILAVSAPVLVYFAQQRVEFTGHLNKYQLPSVTGFESAVGPLGEYAKLLDLHQHETLGVHGISTFWASATALVPRSIWHGKPVGFGTVLGDLLRPDLHGTGFSDLALFQGEWLYAFGLGGLIIMIPIVGIFVRRLDRRLTPFWDREIRTRRHIVGLALVTILIAGLPDLVWGGTFTYVSRAGVRVIPLILLALVARKRPAQPKGVRLSDGAGG
jgi:hypothetical protein